MVTIARDVIFDLRKGSGSSTEVLYGTVELRPTLLHTLGTSAVLPVVTCADLVDGKVTIPNVAPSPDPVEGQVAWAYNVAVLDRFGKKFEWLVGVPDAVTPINFIELPRYFETKPPLFGKGEQGVPGTAATIQIGTVGSGVSPSVTNVGTSKDAVLNFTLPKGDKGDIGAGVPAGGTALQMVRKNAANTTTEWATVDKALVGLGNVDNTSDANKPVSTAQQTALDSLLFGPSDLTKTAAENASTYPSGTTITRGKSVDGWPNVRTDGGTTDDTVVTFKPKNLAGGVMQLVADYYRENGPLSLRKSNSAGEWSNFTTIITQEGLEDRTRLNFLDYGGVRDGITDNSAALTAFLTLLNTEKRTGYVPNGDYILKSFVLFPTGGSDYGLIGESKNKTKFLFRPDTAPSSPTPFTGVSPTRVKLQSFTLDQGRAQHLVNGHAISFKNSESCHFDDLFIVNHGNAAIMNFADNIDAGLYGNNVISNTEADGLNQSNNGFLYVNMHNCYYINVTAKNGGKTATHTPSSGIQFKNRCVDSHIINCTSISYKDGFGLGGDTDNFGPTNNTLIGAYAYDCYISLSMGSALNNKIEIFSARATQNDVRLAANCADNTVVASIDSAAKSGSSIYFGSNFNSVKVKYLPSGVTNLATFIVGSRYNTLLVDTRYASTGKNISNLVTNLSEYTSNYVGSTDSLLSTTSMVSGGTATLNFYDPSDTQNWVAHTGSTSTFGFRSAGTNIFTVSPTIMSPGTDNLMSAGSSSRRFTQVYAVNAAINTSDEREKQGISTALEPELLAWSKVNFVKFKWKDAVNKKGDKARWHFGVIAQDVKRAFEAEGLDPFEYGILCYDEWQSQPAEYDDEGEEISPAIEAGNRYGVRYEEALALECAYLRTQMNR